jgi:hypothetical protein
MENLEHTKMKPKVLRATKPEYQQFKKQTFRNHIYQATRATKFQSYVKDKAEEKKESMGKKDNN